MKVYEESENNIKKIEIDEKDVEKIEYPYLFYLETKFKITRYIPTTRKYLCVEVKDGSR